MTLVNNVSSDMSCLVRKELVKALQWFVLVFEHAFWNVANQERDNTKTTSSIIGCIGSRLKPSPSQVSDDLVDSMKRAGSVSCLLSMSSSQTNMGTLPGLAYGSVYMKIWAALCYLETDPHPEVARMCSVVTNYVRKQIRDHNSQRDSGLGSSSLPPSPKSGGYISGDSPPALHYNTRSLTLNRRRIQHKVTEENEEKELNLRKPLVTTQFVEWSCKKFAQPMMTGKVEDVESSIFFEKEWRYLRNKRVRKEAFEEQRMVFSRRIENQVFTGKVSNAPNILQFHPFEQQIAIAEKDVLTVLDWGRGAKITQCHYNSTKTLYVKITAVEWVNGHDLALLLVAADDGSTKLFRPPNLGSKEMTLIGAWQTFTDLPFKTSGVVLSWEQWTQTIVTSGDTRVIRLWDAERELRSADIPTGADVPVTCLDSSFASSSREKLSSHISVCEEPDEEDEGLKMGDFKEKLVGLSYRGPKMGLVVCGCSDGSVRLFDRRCGPNDAKVRTWMEHGGCVLGVQLRGCQVVSASCQGDVKLYDVRKSDSVATMQVLPPQTMTAFAAYRGVDIYAW